MDTLVSKIFTLCIFDGAKQLTIPFHRPKFALPIVGVPIPHNLKTKQ